MLVVYALVVSVALSQSCTATNVGNHSIYDLLDKDLLPKNTSQVLIGCVGQNCSGHGSNEPTGYGGEGVIQRLYDVHVSFIQPMHTALNLTSDDLRVQHHSWQLCKTPFDNCTWQDIADGVYDDELIIPTAKRIAAFDHPIVLALCNEMPGKDYADACGDGHKYPECYGAYKAMYAHIQDVFEQHGASHNVVWSWNTFNVPAIDKHGNFGNASWDKWYVGDENVSWVGINAFNNPQDGYSNFTSLQSLYSVFYEWVKNKDVHPVFHAFGSYELPGHSEFKSDFFKELPLLVSDNGLFSKIRAAVLYCGSGYDIQTSNSTIATAKIITNTAPIFNALGYANATAADCCKTMSPCCWEYGDNIKDSHDMVTFEPTEKLL